MPQNKLQPFRISQYRLRKIIGGLGILLPIVILLIHWKLLSSISHYYYTSAGIFFIAILFAFGLVLISYVGYPLEEKYNEKISDNWLTTIAGIFIMITVLVPTKCTGSGDELLFCGNGYLFGHNDAVCGAIHLVSAAVFLVALGGMCIYKFTLSPRNMLLYQICGYIVWACVGFLVVMFGIEKIWGIDLNNYVFGYTFILETIAVWAFGVAWLVKGKIYEDMSDLKSWVASKIF